MATMDQTVSKEHSFVGQGAVLAAAFFWSTSGLLIKLLDWHPVVISGMRSLVAALFLLGVRQLFPAPRSVKTAPFPFWGAVFANALAMLTFVIANKLTTSANAILLQYSSPVWAALVAWWLIKEKPHWEHWSALVMVLGGLFIFFKDGTAVETARKNGAQRTKIKACKGIQGIGGLFRNSCVPVKAQ